MPHQIISIYKDDHCPLFRPTSSPLSSTLGSLRPRDRDFLSQNHVYHANLVSITCPGKLSLKFLAPPRLPCPHLWPDQRMGILSDSTPNYRHLSHFALSQFYFFQMSGMGSFFRKWRENFSNWRHFLFYSQWVLNSEKDSQRTSKISQVQLNSYQSPHVKKRKWAESLDVNDGRPCRDPLVSWLILHWKQLRPRAGKDLSGHEMKSSRAGPKPGSPGHALFSYPASSCPYSPSCVHSD